MTKAVNPPKSSPEIAGPRLPIGDVQTRKGSPIKWWAAVGAAAMTLMVYCWTVWVVSGDARPAPQIGDAPSWMPLVDRIYEGITILLLLFTIYQFGYKQWKVERKLTLDCLLILAMTSVWALQDPWENYSGVAYSYNNRFVNLGCPQCHVPGWQSPGGSGKYQFVEPLLFIGLMYGGVLMLGMVGTCWVMRKAKERWPSLGTAGLIGIGLAFGLVLDLLLELPAQRGGGWVWWLGSQHTTLFYGQYYQLPLLEWILWGGTWASFGMLRYFVNDKGETFAERGLDRLKISGKKRTFVRFLALAGALNVMMLCFYNIPYNYISLHPADVVPAICDKPYFNLGMAGAGSPYHCPGRDIPIPLNQGRGYHMTPDKTLAPPTGDG